MTGTAWQNGDNVSLLGLGTAILRQRWRIVRWTAFGGTIAVILALMSKPRYVATAAFVPQGTDAGSSRLAGIAGQLGVMLPSTGQASQSPDFYLRILQSRVLLGKITRDTFLVPELGNRRVPFPELFGISKGDAASREARGIAVLRNMVVPTVAKATGIVELSVSTRWPSVSFAIAQDLLEGVDTFNQHVRQTQATAERQFVEGRLSVARADLRVAEDRLEAFMRQNRQYDSPELTLDRDRLQRDVTMRQSLFTSLSQSYEEVRLREVRDTPVITVVEPPTVPMTAQPRGRVTRVIIGLLFGAFVGVTIGLVTEGFARRRRAGDAAVGEFFEALGDARGWLFRGTRARQ